MKDNFAACLGFTLRYEGGFADDPRDPGGRTMRGVTQKRYDEYRRGRGMPTSDVKLISTTELNDLYRGGYWDRIGGDTMPAGADLSVFDFGVNSGPGRALKAWSRRPSNDGAEIAKAVCAERLSFLHALGTFRAFGRGWTTRVAACEALGVQMAERARTGVPIVVSGRLKQEAAKASAKASSRRKAAAQVGTTGVAGGGATIAIPHLPWAAWAIPLAIVLLVAVLLAVKAAQHRARASAYTAAAAT